MLGIGNYLWRLIPANPILLRVVQGGGKRVRDLVIRCTYLGALIFIVIILLLQSTGNLSSGGLAELSRTSTDIFYWMSYAQLFLVALLAPIFTAGAITQERDSQTYDILLSTPLTNGQIVLGSLLSRLFFIVALLVSGIPIFAVTQIFGGVAIQSIVTAFLIASATAFVTGALAMAIAVFKVGTRRTIFSFYLFIGLYLAIPLVIESLGYCQYRWNPDFAGKPQSHISWFAGVHPFLALRVIFGEPAYRPPDPGMVQDYGWPWGWYLSSPHTFYISLMFALSFVLVLPSILTLRRLAQSTTSLRLWLFQKLRLATGDRTRKPRKVWANPIAWREAKTKASANRAILLRYGFMLAGLAAAVILLVFSSTPQPADCVVGSGGYKADHTIILVHRGVPTVYQLQPSFGGLRLDDNVVEPEALRQGVIVNPQSLRTATGDQRILTALDASLPRMTLTETDTRRFLLGLTMVELAVILLILTQSAASTVTREKEDGTLDLLLATPITSRYYIWGKLRGLVSFVLPLLAVPILSLVLFVFWDLFHKTPWAPNRPWIVYPEALFILPGTFVMVAAFAAILGMQMSLRCRRTITAVMSSVAIVGGLSGAFGLCGNSVISSSNFAGVGLCVGAFSPFTLLTLLINPYGAAEHSFTGGVGDAESRILVFIFAWLAAAGYGLVVWMMYKSMVYNFDMTIRKQAA